MSLRQKVCVCVCEGLQILYRRSNNNHDLFKFIISLFDFGRKKYFNKKKLFVRNMGNMT